MLVCKRGKEMKRTAALLLVSFSLFPCMAEAQPTDCNALARDLVLKTYQSNWSEYNKLLFLSSLTKTDIKTSKEALDHSGKVGVGPISIGPGTWNKDKQDELRSELQKILSIDQLNQSAASLTISSGDENASKTISDCIHHNGGFYVALTISARTIPLLN